MSPLWATQLQGTTPAQLMAPATNLTATART
jgi:hypothetical protein